MTRICLIAGEPSGDFLGAKLIAAIKAAKPDAVFTGVGGPQMIEAGLETLFAYEQLAVMGIAEIAPKLPSILKRIRETIAHIVATKPDIVITIDSPDFGFRVAKAVRKKMNAAAPKLIHYVAPSVWAWREGRAEKVSRFLDGMICLFDFEPPYFEKYGLRSVAVGHPLVEGKALTASGETFREESGIGTKETVIGVLFGSRKGEIRRTGPILRDAVFEMARTMASPPQIVAPTLPHIYGEVFDLLKHYDGPIHIETDPATKYDAFKAMDVAVAVSGTVGLELAALRVPHVIGYKASPITASIAKRLVTVKHVHLANIMADREIVPEFLQEECRAEPIALAALQLLEHPAAQREAFASVAHRLGAGQARTPSEKAAAFVVSFLEAFD